MRPAGQLLKEASQAVCGPRQRAYGPPANNHACTAWLWKAYMLRRFGVHLTVTGRDVCLMNILQKVSRDANMTTRDNLVDIAGYAANAEECFDARLSPRVSQLSGPTRRSARASGVPRVPHHRGRLLRRPHR